MAVNRWWPVLLALWAVEGRGEPLWEAGVGLAVLDTPAYRGADARNTYLLPVPYLIYRGERLRVDRSGVRGLLYSGDRIAIDVSADGTVPVDGAEDTPRVGMRDLDPILEVGPSVVIGLDDTADRSVRLRLPLRAAIATDLSHASHEGWTFHPHLAVDGGSEWRWGMTAGPFYATDDYHAYFYDVQAADVTAARPAFSSDGGYSGFRTTLSISRRFGRLWFGAFARYDDLDGAVFVDSPLVEREESLMVGLGISWVLAYAERPGSDTVR